MAVGGRSSVISRRYITDPFIRLYIITFSFLTLCRAYKMQLNLSYHMQSIGIVPGIFTQIGRRRDTPLRSHSFSNDGGPPRGLPARDLLLASRKTSRQPTNPLQAHLRRHSLAELPPRPGSPRQHQRRLLRPGAAREPDLLHPLSGLNSPTVKN